MVIDETELEGLTEDQRDAYIALKEGRNVFLSGNAGTGKSYVLNRFIDDLEARSVPYTAMAPRYPSAPSPWRERYGPQGHRGTG